MNGLKIFENPDFGSVRVTVDVSNEPVFCAADVCAALGYSNGRKAIADHVDKDDVTKRDTLTNGGAERSGSEVSEPDPNQVVRQLVRRTARICVDKNGRTS